MTKTSFRLLIVILLAASTLGACLGQDKSGGAEVSDTPKTFYFDANLGFTIEYPKNWQRLPSAPPSEAVLSWVAPDEPGRIGATLSVSVKPMTGQNRQEKILEEFTKTHPGFTLAARERVNLDREDFQAVDIVGHTPHRVFLIRIVVLPRRAYLVETSAPPEHFDLYRPLFEELTESFSPFY